MSDLFDPFAEGLATLAPDKDERDTFDPFAEGTATLVPVRSSLGEFGVRAGREAAQAPGVLLEGASRYVDMMQPQMADEDEGGMPNPVTAMGIALGEKLRDWARGLYDEQPQYRPDPARDQELIPQLGQGTGSMVQFFAVPGGVAPKTMAAVLQSGVGGVDDLKQSIDQAQAEGRPVPTTSERDAFTTSAPLGLIEAASEAMPGGGIIRRAAQPLTKLAKGSGTLPAMARVVKETVKQGLMEGLEEVAQQIGQNEIARDLLGFDPERDRTEGAGQSFKVGGLLGALMGGGIQTTAELAGAGESQERPQQASAQGSVEATRRAHSPESAGSSPAPASSTRAPGEPTSAPGEATSAPGEATSAPSLADIMAEVAAQTQREQEAAAAAQRATEQRRADAAERRQVVPSLLEAMQARMQEDDARNFPQLTGLVAQARTLAEDTALGLSYPQREALLSTAQRLEAHAATLAPIYEQLRDERTTAAQAEAAAAEQARKEQIAAERRAIRQAEKAGIGTSGEFDYETAPMAALEARAEAGDERAQEAIMRREEQAELDRQDGREDILEVMRKANLRLPHPEAAQTLRGELRDLYEGEANFGRRQALFAKDAPDLDRLAETLRADHGFGQLQTPDDVLQAVQRSLRGERVLPDMRPALEYARRADQGELDFDGRQRSLDLESMPADPSGKRWMVLGYLERLPDTRPAIQSEAALRDRYRLRQDERGRWAMQFVPPHLPADMVEKYVKTVATFSNQAQAEAAMRHMLETGNQEVIFPAGNRIVALNTKYGIAIDKPAEPLLLDTLAKIANERNEAAALEAKRSFVYYGPVDWSFIRRPQANVDPTYGPMKPPRAPAPAQDLEPMPQAAQPELDLAPQPVRAPEPQTRSERKAATRAARQQMEDEAAAFDAIPPRTDFRDADEQQAYLDNPDNFEDRPYPGIPEGTPLWKRSNKLAGWSERIEAKRQEMNLPRGELDDLALAVTGRRLATFTQESDYADLDAALEGYIDPWIFARGELKTNRNTYRELAKTAPTEEGRASAETLYRRFEEWLQRGRTAEQVLQALPTRFKRLYLETEENYQIDDYAEMGPDGTLPILLKHLPEAQQHQFYDEAGVPFPDLGKPRPPRTGQQQFEFAQRQRTVLELMDAALAAEDWRTWYEDNQAQIRELFGEGADTFADLLAITSIKASVATNVAFALKAYEQLLDGKPFEGFLPGTLEKLNAWREGAGVQGPKIGPFSAALKGDPTAVAVDRHVAEIIFGDGTKASPSIIERARAIVAQVAEAMGWTGRQVQAALWAANIMRRGAAPASYETHFTARADQIGRLARRPAPTVRQDAARPGPGDGPGPEAAAGPQAAAATGWETVGTSTEDTLGTEQAQAQADQALEELQRLYPEVWRQWQVAAGDLQAIANRIAEGTTIPTTVEAFIHHSSRTLAFAYQALRERGRAARRFLHEMGHSYYWSLPKDVRETLREQHRRELEAARKLAALPAEAPTRQRRALQHQAGPLFDERGRLRSELRYIMEDSARGVSEWFAERIAWINGQRVAGRMGRAGRSRALYYLEAAARAVRDVLRSIMRAFATRQGSDPEADFWQNRFEEFLRAGGMLDTTETGRAYAQAKQGEYATQGTLDLDGPVGLHLPPQIRNLVPRWQGRRLDFESNLDKALYYAGAEGNTAVREQIVAHLQQETGLSAGQIAALARQMRQRIGSVLERVPADGTLELPPIMASVAARLTGTQFATSVAPDATTAPQDAPGPGTTDDLHGRPPAGGAPGQQELGGNTPTQRPLATLSREIGAGMLDRDAAQRIADAFEAEYLRGPRKGVRLYPIRWTNQHGTGLIQFEPVDETQEEFEYRLREAFGFADPESAQALRAAVKTWNEGTGTFAWPAGLEHVRGARGQVDAHAIRRPVRDLPRMTTRSGSYFEELAKARADSTSWRSGSGAALREIEFAERDEADPLQAQLEVARTEAQTAREALIDADEALTAVEAELQDLEGSDLPEGEKRTRGREIQARLRDAARLRTERHQAFNRARDRMALIEDRRRLREAGQRTMQERAAEDPREALISEYERLGQAIDDEGRAGHWAAVQMARERRQELRDQLDREHPGWRRGRSGQAAEAAVPEEVAAGGTPIEPQEGELDYQPEPPERDYNVNGNKRRDLEGHSILPDTWTARTWRAIVGHLRDWRGAIPELPTFSWTKIARARDKFLQSDPAFYNRLKEGLLATNRANNAVLRDAEDAVGEIVRPLLGRRKGRNFPARAYARLQQLQRQARTLEADGRAQPKAMREEIAQLQDQIERDPYVLFSRLVLYLDLEWRAQNLFDDEGRPITLPANLNLDEVQARLAELRERAEQHPQAAAIAKALKAHSDMVRQVAEDLQQRELLPGEHLRNPWYFPHLLVEKTSGRMERVKIDTAQDFRGYLLTPVGSNQPIETDYAKAMYYHMVQVLAHNRHADIREAFFRAPYDILPQIRKRATELASVKGRPVSWREVFFTEYAKEGYTIYGAGDGPSMVPALQIDRNRLAQLLGQKLTEEPLQKQLAALGVRGIQLRAEDIQEAMMAGEREVWIVPEAVAQALGGMIRREGEGDTAVGRSVRKVLGLWKLNMLFAPWNYIRYEFNNTVADLEKMLSADPGMALKLPQALRDVHALFTGQAEASENVRQAARLGVLDSVTAQEIGQLPDLRAFDALATDKQRVWQFFRRHNTVAVSKLREATFRYAKYLADLERIKAGARPVYAGAYWRNIEAMQDSQPGANDRAARQAAEISLKTFGDYGDMSVNGQWLRQKLIPFYSWMEVNWRYHANVLRNLRDALAGADSAMAEGEKAAAARRAAVAGFALTRKSAAAFMLRFALPYLAVLAWNNSGDREEIEDELSEEDKRRFHIIVGRNPDGSAEVIYLATAFADIFKWFSGPEAARLAAEVMKGDTDLPTAVGEWSQRIVPDLVNNTVGGVGPMLKVPYMLASRKDPFPDVTDQRTIPAYDMRRRIIAGMTDQVVAEVIERAVNKDYVSGRDLEAWAKQLILQARRRDPQEWAFYGIKDKANDFMEQRTGRSRDSSYDAPDQQVLRNFRRAIFRGDADVALRMYDRLLELGYTSERFSASLRAQDPLAGLGKQGAYGNLRQEFVDGLNPHDRAMLERAYQFYARLSSFGGTERQLFPSETGRGRFRPRPDLVIREINEGQQLTDAELQRRLQADMRRSLMIRN